ncbi:dipeptide ABC transporter ATP binding subunit DppF [Paraburkholderia unamae]|uniref:oligopeptide/dipeptide ABC transporter ATP-binding protein n=1 Tax=Paraburkholderia unamae TaxID=219649 RepID=UPI001CAEB434|nr:ABC transporter ATP-binding protein [Paraburkholderia unamae]CAG9254777.1 dipeptide ABC transporter ATP binding subunit DppF [Paraburkholderia unamae]
MSVADFIRVDDLHRSYAVRHGWLARRRLLRAVSGVSFTVAQGETYGLVGESGSGKSTIAKVLLAAEPATRGDVRVAGMRLDALDRCDEKRLRRLLAPVLQDPYGALNPHMRVVDIVAEPLRAHGLHRGAESASAIDALLQSVGLAASLGDRLPHQLSGGQRQRVAIARALALEPRAIVLDEPVSALDVSVQAQILNLLKDLQVARGLSYLLISHDLAVIAYMADRIGVLYLGQLMEEGSRDDVIRRARHPYTQALVAAGSARLDDASAARGEIPSPLQPPPGCAFQTRCSHAQARCRSERPSLREVPAAAATMPATRSAHRIACHFDLPAVDAAAQVPSSS